LADHGRVAQQHGVQIVGGMAFWYCDVLAQGGIGAIFGHDLHGGGLGFDHRLTPGVTLGDVVELCLRYRKLNPIDGAYGWVFTNGVLS
jgi:hypothetical protein